MQIFFHPIIIIKFKLALNTPINQSINQSINQQVYGDDKQLIDTGLCKLFNFLPHIYLQLEGENWFPIHYTSIVELFQVCSMCNRLTKHNTCS